MYGMEPPPRAFSFSRSIGNAQYGEGFGEVNSVAAQSSGYVAIACPTQYNS